MFNYSFIKRSVLTGSVFLLSNMATAQKASLNILPSGHLIVQADVEGKKGNFIFDTGGGINLFLNNFSKDLHQKESYNFLTAFRATGEQMTVPLFKSKEIIFNGKKFTDTWYATHNGNQRDRRTYFTTHALRHRIYYRLHDQRTHFSKGKIKRQ